MGHRVSVVYTYSAGTFFAIGSQALQPVPTQWIGFQDVRPSDCLTVAMKDHSLKCFLPFPWKKSGILTPIVLREIFYVFFICIDMSRQGAELSFNIASSLRGPSRILVVLGLYN